MNTEQYLYRFLSAFQRFLAQKAVHIALVESMCQKYPKKMNESMCQKAICLVSTKVASLKYKIFENAIWAS